MPDLTSIHPIVVHFTIAFLVAGVVFRWLSLAEKLSFAHHTASLLLVAGALASILAVKSGDEAHGPAERIPGARPVVEEHEEHGERARNVFLAVAGIDVAAWLLRRRLNGHGRQHGQSRQHGYAKAALIASAVIGTLGLWVLYEAAEHGGELVYSYAGGVGTRSGEPDDVGRLLLAGLYHQAEQDRRGGRPEQAAELTALAASRFPDDAEVQLMRAGSLLRDLERPEDTLDLLRRLEVEPGSSLALRAGMLEADAHQTLGDVDGARRVLETLRESFPQNARLARAIEEQGSP